MRSEFFVTDVTFASYKRYEPGYVFRQKKRKFEGVTLILSGEMEWIRGGKTFAIGSGDLLFQQKDDTYQLKVVGEAPAEYMVISYLAEPCGGTRFCAVLQEILCCIIQEYARKASPEGSFAENAMLFMEQNFSLPIHCDLIAYEVGISPSHLRSLFKKEYGKSLVTALNEIRIHHAKNMLKSGVFTLREVASQCGFQNEYYFSRVFKELTGISPGKY